MAKEILLDHPGIAILYQNTTHTHTHTHTHTLTQELQFSLWI